MCPRYKKMSLIFVRNILCLQQMFPHLPGMDTKQMFCVPLVCPPKKHHEQQCVRNKVSSFATTLYRGGVYNRRMKIEVPEVVSYCAFGTTYISHKVPLLHQVPVNINQDREGRVSFAVIFVVTQLNPRTFINRINCATIPKMVTQCM